MPNVTLSNQISGYALDTTLQTTNTTLGNIKTDLDKFNFNGQLLKCDVSGQSVNANIVFPSSMNVFDVSGYNELLLINANLNKNTYDTNSYLNVDIKNPTIVVSGSVGLSSGTNHVYVDNQYLDSSNNLLVNDVSCNTLLTSIKSDLDKNQYDTSGNLKITLSNQPISTNSTISNSSINTAIYGVGSGSSQHQLSTDNSGQMNVNLHDGLTSAGIGSTSNALNTYITNSSLPISGTVSLSSGTLVGINNNVNTRLYDQVGQGISSTSGALNTYNTNNITGFATSANQTSELTKLDTVNTNLSTLNTTLGTLATQTTLNSCLTDLNKNTYDANSNLYTSMLYKPIQPTLNYCTWTESNVTAQNTFFAHFLNTSNLTLSPSAGSPALTIVNNSGLSYIPIHAHVNMSLSYALQGASGGIVSPSSSRDGTTTTGYIIKNYEMGASTSGLSYSTNVGFNFDKLPAYYLGFFNGPGFTGITSITVTISWII
jgi:hypothetical protein